MSGPRWLDRDIAVCLHGELTAEFGGTSGIRDAALLEDALARPVERFANGGATFCELAAVYGFELARHKPFINGNRRIALSAIDVFLQLNGGRFTASEVEALAYIGDVAAGDVEEEVLARWIDGNTEPVSEPSG